ncbi:MAG: asparagine synthase (glutamine-hydrolyzing) [Thermoanaerobaculia bacterium]
MCGIAGVISADKVSSRDVIAMSESIRHRGPDDYGYLVISGSDVAVGKDAAGYDGEVLLAHRRLSILDLSETGRQPMQYRGLYCVFNGEIYNHLELRRELEALGHTFRSRSDTEVGLAAYSEWGIDAFRRFEGMFAFAIADVRDRKVVLARDFFGIKPLYYSVGSFGFAFSSEVAALRDFLPGSATADAARVHDYLTSGVTDFGNRTFFRDIQQLSPGTVIEVGFDCPQNSPIESRYWTLGTTQRSSLSRSQAAEELRQLFLESIAHHLRSDVPVGAALSGGIDSSAIVCAMRRILGADGEIHTFSYVPAEPNLSEECWIDLATKAASTTAHKVSPSSADLEADIDRLVRIQGEPFVTTSIYAQYRVFEAAREAGIKVMLDGQGADEMFGGYAVFRAARVASLVRSGRLVRAGHLVLGSKYRNDQPPMSLMMGTAGFLVPESWHAALRRVARRPMEPQWINTRWFRERDVYPRVINRRRGGDVLRAHLRQTLLESNLPKLLRYEDRNSMAFSVESRVPFLTPKLADFVFSLPEEFLIADDGTTKAILRDALRGLVPNGILDRRDKVGFETPQAEWLSSLRGSVERDLMSKLEKFPFLQANAVRHRWGEVLQCRDSDAAKDMWRFLNVAKWAQEFAVDFS